MTCHPDSMKLFFLVLALLHLVFGITHDDGGVGVLLPPLPSHTIFQMNETGTWIESVVARSNGDLLFTTVQPTPRLYLLSGPHSANPKATLIHEFPNMTGLTGITETSPDSFAVAGGKFNGTAHPLPDTFSLWQVRVASFRGESSCSEQHLKIRKVVNLPYHTFPNGLKTLPMQRDVVLIADSYGSLLRADLGTNTLETIATLPQMAIAPGAVLPLGINGISIRDGRIFWTNSFTSTIWEAPLTSAGYLALNSSTDVTRFTTIPGTFLDDFTIGNDGTVFAATNPNNTVVAVRRDDGKRVIVAGGQTSTTVAGAVDMTFGRTMRDKHILYVVTSGALALPVNGTFVEPAKIVALDTRRRNIF